MWLIIYVQAKEYFNQAYKTRNQFCAVVFSKFEGLTFFQNTVFNIRVLLRIQIGLFNFDFQVLVGVIKFRFNCKTDKII